MEKPIDFKMVAYQARFGMLGSIKMPTPDDFSKLSESEKNQLYSKLFDLHHDLCDYLASSLSIENLQTKYYFG